MSARDNILAKLRQANAYPMREPDSAAYYAGVQPVWHNDTERLKHWAAAMRAVKTEIHWVTRDNWTEQLCRVAAEKNLRNMLLPLQTEHGRAAAAALAGSATEIRPFDRLLEDWKDEFFADIDAGFTDVRCGIAQTGTLMLWPTPEQPRTLSLVPPVHICLFDAAQMYDHFYAAIQGENMAEGMPTNVVLVSGPSKTADIQLTLAFGAHGPRDMVVLALVPDSVRIEDLEMPA